MEDSQGNAHVQVLEFYVIELGPIFYRSEHAVIETTLSAYSFGEKHCRFQIFYRLKHCLSSHQAMTVSDSDRVFNIFPIFHRLVIQRMFPMPTPPSIVIPLRRLMNFLLAKPWSIPVLTSLSPFSLDLLIVPVIALLRHGWLWKKDGSGVFAIWGLNCASRRDGVLILGRHVIWAKRWLINYVERVLSMNAFC